MAHVLTDFIAKITPSSLVESATPTWKLHVDDSSNNKGSGARLVVDVYLAFSFSMSNNQAEYEACMASSC